MTILEQAKRYNQEQEESLQTQLEALPHQNKFREQLAQMLDDSLDGLTPRYTYIRWRFEFRFNTVEEAREFTSRVLDKLGLEKAEKEFEGYGGTPYWRYTIEWNNLSIRIEPAEPGENCKPVLKASASSYWVCERGE